MLTFAHNFFVESYIVNKYVSRIYFDQNGFFEKPKSSNAQRSNCLLQIEKEPSRMRAVHLRVVKLKRDRQRRLP